MSKYDMDGNMSVDRDEAKPLFKTVFKFMEIAHPDSQAVKNG